MWRFLTYMLCHNSLQHLTSNLITQLLFGIPLEYLYAWWRVMLVYLAGVLGGSLGLLTIHPGQTLIGSSAGGFALLFAYFIALILNWQDLKHRIFYLIVFLYVLGFITAYSSFSSNDAISHVSHISGALCGFFLAPIVLHKIDFKSKLKYVLDIIF